MSTRKGLIEGFVVAAGLTGLAAAAVAPRPRSYERQRTWDYMRCFRYAHRGLHDSSLSIPENSLSAFERAASLGFGSELDVHLSADKKLVVIHDSDITRMCGVAGTVESLSSDELRALRLGGTSEKVPFFSEVLEVYERLAPRIPLIVELKVYRDNYADLCSAVMAELDKHALITCVESFDPRALQWLRANRGDVFRGQLAQNFLLKGDHSGRGPLIDAAASLLLLNVAARPDFIAYRYSDYFMPSSLLATKVMGGAYAGWTIKSEKDLVECERRGGIGIFEGFVPAVQSSAYSND